MLDQISLDMQSLVDFVMSSGEDDTFLLLAAVILRRKRKTRRRLWVHPYLRDNADTHSAYIVSQQLQSFLLLYAFNVLSYRQGCFSTASTNDTLNCPSSDNEQYFDIETPMEVDDCDIPTNESEMPNFDEAQSMSRTKNQRNYYIHTDENIRLSAEEIENIINDLEGENDLLDTVNSNMEDGPPNTIPIQEEYDLEETYKHDLEETYKQFCREYCKLFGENGQEMIRRTKQLEVVVDEEKRIELIKKSSRRKDEPQKNNRNYFIFSQKILLEQDGHPPNKLHQ
ncbi:hypothetical protein QE152_g10600 [Popillia japonica]|uniref:Uncharacterized protein n=1 Tax=Popillia japonica TaxID=7064 RepID=A0AAW1LQH0_POPJA